MGKLAAALVCAVAACVLVAGCADGSALRAELVGTWDYGNAQIAAAVGGDMSAAQIEAAHQLAFLNLEEDGSAVLVALGEPREGSWEVDGGKIAITFGGNSAPAVYESGTLTIGSDAASISLSKSEAMRAVPDASARDAAMAALAGFEGALPSIAGEAERAYFEEPIVVADDDAFGISVVGSGTNALADPGFLLLVQNRSANTAYLIPSGFTVGGTEVAAYGTEAFAPGEEREVFLALDAADLDSASAKALSDVQGALVLYDDVSGSELSSYWLAV